MKKLLSVFLVLFCIVALVGCDSGGETPGNLGGSDSGVSDTENTGTYKIGEVVTISKDGKDLYTIKVNSIKSTTERNEFSDKDPKAVVIINYTYENLAKEDSELTISSFNFKVIDGDGNVCEIYPANTSSYAQGTPVGAKCTAEEAYGLMSDVSDFKLMYYDNMFNSKADATFELSIGQ